MKRFLRILSVLVVITLLPVSGLTACMNKKSVNYKDIGKAAIVSTDGKALPDRPYVIEKETEPEKLTLQEFLTSDKTTIKAFTLSNEIENTLMSAATLTDVIHSRSETQGLKSFQAEVKALIASYGQQKVLELSGKSVSIEELKKIDAKITQLFASRPGVVSVYSGPIKGTWTTPDKVILRWTPENEWIPDGGYDVFRTISGKSEKIAAGLGGEKTISLLASGGKDYAGVIKTVYDNAKLDSSEISMLGYASVEDFNKKVYSKGIVNSTKTRITGDLDYKLQLDERISIPGSMKERMPASDSYSASAFHLAKDIDALPSLIKAGSAVGTSSLNSGVSAINSGSGSVSIAQDELTTEGRLTKKLELPEVKAASVDAKALKISEVLDARNNIMTKALMDPEFASDSGLGCEDDLQAVEGLKIEDPIEYSVVPVGDTAMDLQTVKKLAAGEKLDKEYRISIKYGVETKLETPQGLDGYGMDNVVSLRWQAPANDYDRSVVSGYNIERKKKGESGFTRINGLPVAISYNEDENGILYEVPVFYMDRDLKNGDEATYRIQSLDIFGRVSEYSADLEIKVCKVAPPTAPSVGEPDLSSKVAKNKERSPLSYSDLISFNSKKKGVILPIGRVTDDTEVFVIYRCKALGTGAFDMPQEQVRINIEPYITDDKPRVATSTIRSRFLINPKTPAQTDAIYYDTAIEPGYYYKYWVSAVDSWGNESEWSESKTIGYPLTDAPAEVLNPQASMKKNELVTDKSIVPPGFYDRFTTINDNSLQTASGIHGVPAAASVSGAGGVSGLQTETGVQIQSGLQLQGGQSGTATLPAASSAQTGTAAQILPITKLTSSTDTSPGVTFSESLSMGSAIPEALSLLQDNLPKARDIHDIIVLKNEDLEPDGSASVSWYHYSGKGVAGYLVYRAYSDDKQVADISGLSEEQLVQDFSWKLVGNNVQTNQLKDMVEKKDDRLYIYMVCLLPEEIDTPELNGFRTFLPAGWILLDWDKPDDPQLSYYRVYRAEVDYFKDSEDLSKLKWVMAADHLKYTTYSEKVDQTYAHYYYFKVVSVSTWGVDSKEGSITKYRVPSTSPPAVPTMLMPFSKKAVNTVHWVGVPHASRYEIYRHKLPRFSELDINLVKSSAPEVFETLFSQKLVNDIYYTNPVKSLSAIKKTAGTGLRKSGSQANAAVAGKFKTLQLKKASEIKTSIQAADMGNKLEVYSNLVDKYGVLAVSPYSELDYEAAKTLYWEKIGEINIPLGEDSSGERSYADKEVLFGDTYLYTIQAWNDDNLGSNKPEPVSVFTRKGEAFPPVTGTSWEKSGGKPVIRWNAAKDPNLTTAESKEYVAGYIVYRSNTEAGQYYQCSGLIPNDETSYKDENANLTAENWYKIKVVDTAGYISEFSAAVMAKSEAYNLLPSNSFKLISSTERQDRLLTVAMSGQPVADAGKYRNNRGSSADRSTPAYALTFTRVTIRPDIVLPSFTIVTPTPTVYTRTAPTPTPYTRPTPTPTEVPSGLTHSEATATPTINPNRITVPTVTMTTVTRAPAVSTPTATPLRVLTTPKLITPAPGTVIADTMLLNGFTISKISIAGKTSGSGEGILNIEGGWQIPVKVTITRFKDNVILVGSATQKDPVSIGSTGVYFKAVKLVTEGSKSTVTGYVKRASGNMAGDMLTLDMNECAIIPKGIIYVTEIPVFHYENLTFTGVGKISVNLNKAAATGTPTVSQTNSGLSGITSMLSYGSGFINLHEVTVETSMGLETVDNKGFEFTSAIAGIDSQGRLSGTFKLAGAGNSQSIRTVIPAGLFVGAKNGVLVYADGSVNSSKSFLTGKVRTPYETFEDAIPKDPDQKVSLAGNAVSLQSVNNIIKVRSDLGIAGKGPGAGTGTAAASLKLSEPEVRMVNGGLCYMAEQAQSNALLVAPEAVDDSNEIVSSIPYAITNWDGKGFVIEETTMTPTLVGQTPFSTIFGTGTSQALGATPGKVALDLSRETAYTGDTTEDTKLPEWMGVVVKYGNVSLPPSYVKTDGGERVRFNVEDGQLLYDQNGFFYQNQAYTPQGVSADFGEALGGFTDVMVFNVVIDLYNNITNLQLDGDVAVPMLNSRLKVRLYTDKDKGNKLVCSVLETEKFDPAGTGKIKLKVMNGYLDSLGMHIDGTLDLGFGKDVEMADMQFNELVIPADTSKVKVEDEKNIYGRMLFDKPYLVKFYDFPMEMRALSMITAPSGKQIKNDTYSGEQYDTTLTLWGGMQLSDNLPSDASQDVDRIIIGSACSSPEIRFNDSASAVNMDFEDFATFDGVGTPLPPSGDDGIVEYDTSGLEALFNGAMDFGGSKVEVNARIGYDKKMTRSFFAIAIYYDGAQGITFGYGEINQITGMIGYNLDLDKNADGTYAFSSEKDSLFNSIDTLAVNRTSGGNYFFGISATMYLKYGELCLGQVRNLHLIVEKGPTVEIGGFYYGPTSIAGLYGTDNDSLREMGVVRMGYYHDRRLFQFSLTLTDFGMYGFYVNGDIGFEICPDFWEFRIGYPTPLSASFGGYGGTYFGFAIRDSDIDESYIKAQGGLSYDTGDIMLGIVYIRGFLAVGGDGYYLIDEGKLYIHAYLNGGVEGGVKALGKRFNVISLMLNAEGTLQNTSDVWHLDASASISYHVDLWLTDIGGSVGWGISQDF